MHMYAFGSVCRGEIDHGSDVDVLALAEGFDPRLDPDVFSIYSYRRIGEIWDEGNPFAWHLAKESRLLFSSDGEDYLQGLQSPGGYRNAQRDCTRFQELFVRARSSLESHCASPVFELSTIFLAIRNFATCYALGYLNMFEFSRYSARRIGDKSLVISDGTFTALERSRILSTRGHGEMICEREITKVLDEAQTVSDWMHTLMMEI